MQLHELHYNLGYILHQQADLTQAATHYLKAIALSHTLTEPSNTEQLSPDRPSSPRSSQFDAAAVHHNLAGVLAEQRQWLAAIAHYRQAIALQPQNLLSYCNLGSALLRQGDAAAALDLYQQVLAQPVQFESSPAPHWALLYYRLGQVYQIQKQWDEAIAAYQTAVEWDATQAEFHACLGQIQQRRGNHAVAITCFDRALQLNPALLAGVGDRALSLLVVGRLPEALQQFRLALSPQSSFITAYCDWMEKLSVQAPDDELLRARIACGRLLSRLQQQPEHPEIYPELIQTLHHWAAVFGEYGVSEFLHITARSVAPTGDAGELSSAEQVEFCLRFGAYLQQEGHPGMAVLCYRLAQQVEPENPHVYRALGEVLQHQQDWQGAIAAYQQTLTLRRSTTLPAEAEIAPPDLPTPIAAPPCEGLNCESCLQRITNWFQPIHQGQGVYHLPPVEAATIPPLPPDGWPDPAFSLISNGRIWVAPKRSLWKICNVIAVFDAAGTLQVQHSRDYPGQLPGCLHPDAMTRRLPLLEQLPPPQTISGVVAVLAGLSGNVYFHWMVDILPRLELLRQAGFDWQQIDAFLVNSQQQPFQRETLRYLGVPEEKVIESDRHSHIQAETLLLPAFPGPLGWVQPWALNWLRAVFIPESCSELHQISSENESIRAINGLVDPMHSLNQSTQHTNCYLNNSFSHIYISRTDASYRRLLNEPEVVDHLQSQGFQTIVLDTLSVREQAQLFSRARVIVAAHGSSLTNLVFCQPGTDVVEITSPHYVRHYYWQISRQLQLNHWIVWGRSLSCSQVRQLMYPNTLMEDLWVDIPVLDRAIAKLT